MNDTTQTLLRSVLKIGAGYFISKGFFTDSQSMEIISAIVGLVAVLWGVFHRNANPPSSNATTGSGGSRPNIPLMLLLSTLILTLVDGCKSTPNLEMGGAYAPVNAQAQPDLFIADSAYKLAYDTVDGVFKFERDNRAALQKISPGIKAGLDKIRPIAWKIDQRWCTARQAYVATPGAGSLSTLQGILAEMQRLIPAAQALISTKPTT